MSKLSKRLIAATGITAGSVLIASLSAYVTTKFFLKIAIDRNLPELVKRAPINLSGSSYDAELVEKVKEYSARLAAKDNETVEIEAGDGVKLIGHWIPCENAKRVIIAMHGWRSSWNRDFCMVSETWEKCGCSVLYVEQRGQNASGGDYMGFGLTERYDCLDWIRWVTEKCGESVPLYLCGVSMGATTVLMASGLGLPSNVKGIIADCGFTSPHAIWKHVANNNLHLSFGLRGAMADALLKKKINIGSNGYSTVTALKTNKTPVLFIHGSDDHFVPVNMTYENYKAAVCPKDLLIVPGADHAMSYYVEKDRYVKAVVDFFGKYDHAAADQGKNEAGDRDN